MNEVTSRIWYFIISYLQIERNDMNWAQRVKLKETHDMTD